jgi:hypothetical protein
MADDAFTHFGIGTVKIDEAFLNQVVSSMRRRESSNSGSSISAGPTPESREITPQMRDKARVFIETYFLSDDRDA